MWPFTSINTGNVKKLKKIADKVVAKEEEYAKLTDEELKNSTVVLKQRLEKGETLDDILPDAYATVREAAYRVLKMKHFYVQILGGIALHQGRIAEMRTGEGKTLVATLPAYLNALTGKGVHVVTVNEYLAKRDAEWMGKVYTFLGLTVGVISSDKTPKQKQEAYNCDICYATNNELGFDYLRDNMAVRKQDRVQREHNFCIVDEVDSILIDEARTPLIISGAGTKSSETYVAAQKFVKTLNESDYDLDVKTKSINLTEQGVDKAEKFFNVPDITDVSCLELTHYINNALRANFTMKLDENYIVKDDEIVIIDEFTGRMMEGRRYSEGLHQAIEAKEGVKIKDENKTLATITFQNYFRKYKKLSGMTGTAKTEETEFMGIYKLDVVVIPTNNPPKRIDDPDILYRTKEGKFKAIIEEIKAVHETGRPILVGTTTIEKSEELSKALRREKIQHTVLNAKNHEKESEIVAQAGRLNAVTIATNMAGRGTDILLGGNAEFMAKKKMKEKDFSDEEISFATSFVSSDDERLNNARKVYNEFYTEFKKITDEEKKKVLEIGGLHIIGTERHESRRIDNQLRGRAGRQGDPGSTIFYLSLEDDLIYRFGDEQAEKLQQRLDFLRFTDNIPLQLRMASSLIESAQKRIEKLHYAQRRTTTQFDDILNKQREIIYNERNKVLDGIDIHEEIMSMYPDVVGDIVYAQLDTDKPYFEWDLEPVNRALEVRLFPKGTNILTQEFVDDCEPEDVVNKLVRHINEKYEDNIKVLQEYGQSFAGFERSILLRVVDSLWMNHIDQMTLLRKEIHYHQDPLNSYKQEGFELFDKMISNIKYITSSLLFNTKIDIQIQNPQNVPNVPKANSTHVQKTVVKDKETGRNDPCPCGSGKKYKNCCGKENK